MDEPLTVALRVLTALDATADPGELAAAAAPVAGWTTRELVRVAARLRARGALTGRARRHLGQAIGQGAARVRWAAAVGTLQRDGHAREEALRALGEARDPALLPFVLLRLDDIVPATRALAAALIEGARQPAFADALASSLALFDLLGGRRRGQSAAVLRAATAWLAAPAQRAALDRATAHPDPLVRRAAFRLAFADEPGAVRRALLDPALAVRAWAARTAAAGRTPEAVRSDALPLLRASRSAQFRLLALRAEARDRAPEALLDYLVDPSARVRLEARLRLRARGAGAPDLTRPLALVLLADPAQPAARHVGALGALADVGTRADEPLVAAFAADARPRVRREAARTLGLLG